MSELIKFKALLSLIFLVMISGCSFAQSNKEFKSFPRIEQLRHSRVEIRELISPSSIHLINDTIILVDKNLEHAIHFYNVSNWSSIGSYGKRGKGPAEVEKPKFHGQFTEENGETYLWFSDIRSFKLFKVSLTKMINDIDSEPEISYRIPPELALSYKEIYAVSDTEFVGTVAGEQLGGRFFHIDMKKKTADWMPNFPKQNLKVPEHKIGYLYSSAAAFNRKTNQIASGMYLFDRIDIVNVLEEKVLTIFQEGNSEIKEVDLRDDSRLFPLKTEFYYTRAYSTENYIYLLYANNTEQQIAESRKSPTELHVFDWDGNPIYKGQLDMHSLGSFFVDEKTRKLYAINYQPEDDDDMIVSFTLSKFVNEKRK